jgi:Bacterial Ig-like domain (group 3)
VTLTTGALTLDPVAYLTGTDSFVASGPLTMSYGSHLSTSGTVDAYGGLTIDANPYVPALSGTTLNNHGTATLDTTAGAQVFLLQGATINNLAGATFTIIGPGGALVDQDNSAVAFNNAGTLTCDVSTGGDFDMSSVAVANSGWVDVQQGTLGLGNVTNSGTVTVTRGTNLNVGDYTQTGGSTVLDGATINGGSLEINAGALVGIGTISGCVASGGRVIPGGGAAALLTIKGSYTQSATGSLNIAIGGTIAGSQYSQLAVSGASSLSGTVNVALINGFQPALGNTFQPLTFASSSGAFGFYNGIVLGNRLLLDPTLNPTNLTLTVQPAVTTTTLAAPPSPSVSGQSVTFTAAVTVALPPTTIDPVPTGVVTFYDNGTSIGTGMLSVVSGQDQATFTTNKLSTASHPITAEYTSGDGNFVPSAVSSAVTEVVDPASTTTSVGSSGTPSVHGQSVTFTATISVVGPGSTAVAYPTGAVTFYDGSTSIGIGMLSVVSGQDQATFSTTSLSTATHSITAAYTSGDGNFTANPASTAISQMVNKDTTTTTAGASPSSANLGQTVTFTATVMANSPGSGTPTGTVDFYDTTTSTDLTPGGIALSSGTASFSTTSLAAGPHTIKATYSGDGNFVTSSGTATTITIGQTIFVLDPSAGGALSLSGSASINISGGLYVDSSSSSALSVSGAPSVKASVVDVHGGVQKSGSPSFSPAPVTGAAVVTDPLASLPLPSTSGLTNYGAENLSGASSATIKPGIYSSISVSGSASLTLSAGTYIIEGGGFAVSGAGSVTGSGVMIVNAGSDYPNTGGTYGSISLSGSGSYKLTPPISGTYAGIVIFQTRDNSKAMTVSGAASGMTGTIYAAAASLTISGSGALNAALDVDTLTMSGAAVANTVTLSTPSGTVAYAPNQIRDAYGINPLGLDGTGQTIAIVDAYDDPSIFQAVDAFDSQFTLTDSGPTLYSQYGPASSFLTVLNQYGQATYLPSTDPNGPGTDNWEVEEALDVEWAHAIAPGAQIILVEANSQSLSDLMASVATAAAQPGVSVVSMSWGFAEGQAVFASDEALYDSYFDVPGVTFVASTGDYGAADPEYPAFSPNVVAVGGTSLTLNADNSYNSETGWGYYSNSVGAFIGSGGGISLYEPEPAYQQGVQSTGYRTTPDVSMVADPATGVWIADTYNLDPNNPFEIVGGTSVSAPAWAGLFALVNQGRATAGETSLNSSTPTDAQQALYMLPQSDYNSITSGDNGYTANAGYNLVTGLGTPVANLLVPDLIAYQGAGTAYTGSGVGALQDAGLVNSGASSSSTMDVFSVFDALTVAQRGLGDAQGQATNAAIGTPSAAITAGRRASEGLDRETARATYLAMGRIANPSYDRMLGRGTNPGQTAAIDQVLGTLPDMNADDTLIGDLALEQVSVGAPPRHRLHD